MISTLKHPSAWIPIVLSLTVLAMFLIGIALFGPPIRQADVTCIGTCRRPDEGTAAHLFQIWLVLEIFMIGFFAVRWLPKNPTQALMILALQIVAVIVACAPVYYFHL